MLLKKTKGVVMHRLYANHEILEHIVENAEQYKNIEVLQIDYDH